MAIQLGAAPSFDEEVAKEFFKDSDGSDPWAGLEDQAGLRRRIVQVTVLLTIALVALLTSVALLGDGPQHTITAAHIPLSSATAQNDANWIAMERGCPANPSTPLRHFTFAAPNEVLSPETSYQATILTTAGTFRVALNQQLAPRTVNSFIFLAEVGYFNCNTFDRVVRGGYDVTGDPTGTGSGSPGYIVPAERPWPNANSKAQYPVGSVALANTGLYDAGGSEWFVVTGPKGESLPNSYSLFGRVTSGLAVLKAINRQGSLQGAPKVAERVLSVTIQTHRSS